MSKMIVPKSRVNVQSVQEIITLVGMDCLLYQDRNMKNSKIKTELPEKQKCWDREISFTKKRSQWSPMNWKPLRCRSVESTKLVQPNKEVKAKECRTKSMRPKINKLISFYYRMGNGWAKRSIKTRISTKTWKAKSRMKLRFSNLRMKEES